MVWWTKFTNYGRIHRFVHSLCTKKSPNILTALAPKLHYCSLRRRRDEKKTKRKKMEELNLKETRPVWTGFKIAVRHKLLTHYKKAKVLYD
jgi:hypothetical protein